MSSQCHILLVEDDAANVMVASAMLEMMGYSFDVARSGTEAVEKAKARSFAIIIMDIRLKDMDGLEATRLIREFERKGRHRPVQIISVTANALVGDRERCMDAGMNDYLMKPYKFDELSRKLAALQSQSAA